MVPLVRVGYDEKLFETIRAEKVALYESISVGIYNTTIPPPKSIEMVKWVYPGPKVVVCLPDGNWGNGRVMEELSYSVPSRHGDLPAS
jgi:hypothetical protein